MAKCSGCLVNDSVPMQVNGSRLCADCDARSQAEFETWMDAAIAQQQAECDAHYKARAEERAICD